MKFKKTVDSKIWIASKQLFKNHYTCIGIEMLNKKTFFVILNNKERKPIHRILTEDDVQHWLNINK